LGKGFVPRNERRNEYPGTGNPTRPKGTTRRPTSPTCRWRLEAASASPKSSGFGEGRLQPRPLPNLLDLEPEWEAGGIKVPFLNISAERIGERTGQRRNEADPTRPADTTRRPMSLRDPLRGQVATRSPPCRYPKKPGTSWRLACATDAAGTGEAASARLRRPMSPTGRRRLEAASASLKSPPFGDTSGFAPTGSPSGTSCFARGEKEARRAGRGRRIGCDRQHGRYSNPC
jgi:hypothetical protein